MLKVGLTGGIATGKSYVLSLLHERGLPTIDADDIVHEALGAATPTTRTIAGRFGSDLLRPDGSIDRALLGARVFRDDEIRRQIEAIVHPVVWQRIHSWYAGLGRPIGVASIPLLYETGREGDFDVVVVTYCPPEQQLQRVLHRAGMSEEGGRQRIAAQMPADEKARRADVVIATGGSKADTARQVDELVRALHARSSSHSEAT